MSRIQACLFGALLVGYALLSHYSNLDSAPRGLGVALSFGPVLLIGVVLLWRWVHPWLALTFALCAGAAAVRYWGFLTLHYETADLIEQCGAYGLLAFSFAHSLLRVPLCTRLAERMHGALSLREIAYTRAATAAWAVFYALLALTIAILYFAATPKAWSLFVNFATFGLIAVACLADYLLRQRLLPRRPGHGFLSMLQRTLVG